MRTERIVTRRGFLRTSATALCAAPAGAWLMGGNSRAWGQRTVASIGAPAGLTVERFHELHKQLSPADDEPLQAIPWKVAINEARALAAEQKKPILMLSRSGHPLGCT